MNQPLADYIKERRVSGGGRRKGDDPIYVDSDGLFVGICGTLLVQCLCFMLYLLWGML